MAPMSQVSARADKPKRTQPLSLRRNFSWAFIGNVVYAALQWAMLIVLAKAGTKEMVGLFTLGLSVTAPIIMLANAQLRNVQAADVKQEYSFGDYFGQRIISSIVGYIAIIIISLASQYSTEALVIILMMGIAKVFEMLSDIFFGLIQQYEQMDYIGKSQIIKGIFSFVTLTAMVLITNSVFWAVTGLAIAWLLVLLFYDIPNSYQVMLSRKSKNDEVIPSLREALRPRFDTRMLLRLTWVVAPLGIVSLLNSLVPNLPRYVIESSVSIGALGIFGSLSYMTVAGETVVMAMGFATTPRLASLFLDKKLRGFLRLLGILLGILIIMGLAGIIGSLLLGREIITLLYQPEYAEEIDAFVWLMIASSMLYIGSFLGYVLTAIRAYRSQVILVTITAITTGISSLILIPEYNLVGAGMALSVSGFVKLITSLVALVVALRRGMQSAGKLKPDNLDVPEAI